MIPRQAIMAGLPRQTSEDYRMEMILVQPIVALAAGVLILIMPRLLNFIVAIYLIIVGITGLMGTAG